MDGNTTPVRVRILDLNNRVLYAGKPALEGALLRVNLPVLSKGIYVLQVLNEDQEIMQSFRFNRNN